MQLIYGAASGFSRKARVVAHELGLTARLDLCLINAQKDVAALSELNPLGKIPVLVDRDSIIFDSVVICEYLCALYGGEQLLPLSGPARWQVLTWAALGDGLTEAGMLARAEAGRDRSDRPSPALQWQLDKIRRGLDRVEVGAGDGTLMASREIDLGQIAVACALGWIVFRLPNLDLFATRPQLASWFERIHARPSLQATIPQG